jgi:hypothetical protein
MNKQPILLHEKHPPAEINPPGRSAFSKSLPGLSSSECRFEVSLHDRSKLTLDLAPQTQALQGGRTVAHRLVYLLGAGQIYWGTLGEMTGTVGSSGNSDNNKKAGFKQTH